MAYTEYIAANTYQGNEEWNWQSEEKWQEYKHIRKRYQTVKNEQSAYLGFNVIE
jgi:hypothetical protein